MELWGYNSIYGYRKKTTAEPSKPVPVPDSLILSTPVFDGDELSTSTLTGTFKDPTTSDPVAGVLTWDAPSTVISATGNQAWTFTPTDLETYGVATGVVQVVVILADSFVTKWNTENTSTGSSNDNQVMLPIIGGAYNFMAYWGDGTSDLITDHTQPEVTHTYPAKGIYTIVMEPRATSFQFRDSIRGWRFNNTGDRLKILEIKKWGLLNTNNLLGAFFGCANLIVTATDPLQFRSDYNSLSDFFRGCTSLTTVPNIHTWVMPVAPNIQNMFSGCTKFNQNLSNWTANKFAGSMLGAFQDATSFNNGDNPGESNTPLTWDTENVTTMSSMFNGATAFNQELPFDVKKVTAFIRMFNGATAFNQNLNHWDLNTAAGVSLQRMFLSANWNNGDDPGDPGSLTWNTSQVTDMLEFQTNNGAFNQDMSAFDVTNVTNFRFICLNATAFDDDNYASTVKSWAAQGGWAYEDWNKNDDLQDGGAGVTEMTFADASLYGDDEAEDARDFLVAEYGWVFKDGDGTHAP